ncbi:hypothetical protein RchiOBHm_Chr3g0448991 [Rosa chinensis]|uniref:Uncharacterized protein n=1 Tax=Rosa chinensis TaxID=74649 RepID=A0A2P6R5D1_ROSCH|nr:hypothetical protein RchiOBHm_Chr3g0448991 [Rosa chinensis]
MDQSVIDDIFSRLLEVRGRPGKQVQACSYRSPRSDNSALPLKIYSCNNPICEYSCS